MTVENVENTQNTQEQDIFLNLKARLNQNPADFEAASMLGNICYDNQEPAQAVVYYRIALDIDPTSPTVRTDMGTMYWQMDNVAQAEQAFRQVIEEHAGFGNAYLNLGFLLMHAKQQIKEARVIWTDLITGWPKDAAAPKMRDLLVETMN